MRELLRYGRAVLVVLALLARPVSAGEAEAADIRAARTLFEANLDAIRRRDRAAYLACYLESETLARTGPEGLNLGYDGLAKTAGENWPDTFDASDLELVPVEPGVVYGTYRYRVRYGAEEQTGLSERLFRKTPNGWKIAMTSAFPALPGTPPPARALVGATLVDGTGGAPVKDAVVLLRAGKIVCAGKGCAVPSGVSVVNVQGHWITPGLVDAHVHFSQTGWADGRPDSLDVRDRYPYEKVAADLKANPERWFRSQLCSGVTAVFDVGGYPWTIALGNRAASSREPHVSAAGPLLSTIDFWLNLPGERQFLHLTDPEAARSHVRYLAAQGADAVKVWYIVTPERSVEDSAAAVLAAGEEARKARLPLIVHATGLAEAKVALKAGAHLLVHGVSDKPVDDEFIALALKNRTVYCPTLTVFDGYVRMFDAVSSKRPPAVDDPGGCVDRGTLAKIAETAGVLAPPGLDARVAANKTRAAEMDRIGNANLKRLASAGVTIAMGTDAGNPLTLHGPSVFAEMEAMHAAGLSPARIIAASTRGGSLAMGLEKEIGTIEKGKIADLLVLAADPTADIANVRKIRYVVRGGVVRSIEELKAVVGAAK